MIKLNLMPSMAKFQAEKIRFSKKVKSISMFVLLVWAVSLTIIMVIYWLSRLNLSKLNDKYKTLESDYKNMSENIIINQQLRYKAKLVSQILSSRFEYGATFSKMDSLFGEEVMIESMELVDNEKFTVSARVIGDDMMDMVEERVADINDGLVKEFVSAKLESVSVAGQEWSFGLEVTL